MLQFFLNVCVLGPARTANSELSDTSTVRHGTWGDGPENVFIWPIDLQPLSPCWRQLLHISLAICRFKYNFECRVTLHSPVTEFKQRELRENSNNSALSVKILVFTTLTGWLCNICDRARSELFILRPRIAPVLCRGTGKWVETRFIPTKLTTAKFLSGSDSITERRQHTLSSHSPWLRNQEICSWHCTFQERHKMSRNCTFISNANV